ncbi:endo-1,4-beta-xylanase [Patescibacteria group bacterium]|nr:endo-1,4-beta-xylanase [Patescibacteria group bacterium]
MNIVLHRHQRKWPLTVVGVIFIVLILVGIYFLFNRPVKGDQLFGLTYSVQYAEDLGLDSHAAFLALLEDLEVKRVRLPFYWSRIEAQNDHYDWREMDWYIKQAEDHGVEITAAIGRKVPRWPECFIPDWAETLEGDYLHAELMAYLETLVTRYRDSEAIVRWQVENEAFFPFGVCPRPDVDQHLAELTLVRSLDDRPIQATVSGELEPWFDAAALADVLGISMYRVTWNDFFGYFFYPISPSFYAARANSVRPLVDRVIISELQAEPWFPEPMDRRTPAQWYQVFDADMMRKNIYFAEQTGLDEVYLWGAEWWYFLKINGEDGLWNVAREAFAK